MLILHITNVNKLSTRSIHFGTKAARILYKTINIPYLNGKG